MKQTYFIECERTGLIKIGVSEKPWGRLSKIQSDNPGELVMLAIVAKGEDYERAMHRLFERDHVRGEWFEKSTALTAYIDSLPDAVKPRRPVRTIMTIEGTTLGDVELAQTLGIAKSYASHLRSGWRPITIKHALALHAKTGERIGPLIGASDADIDVLKRFDSQPEFFSDRCRAGRPASLRLVVDDTPPQEAAA